MRKIGWVVLVGLCLCFGAVYAQDEPTTFNGYLSKETPEKDFPLTLHAGDAVLITTEPDDEDNVDTVLSLYDPSGTLVAKNDDGSIYTVGSQIAYAAPVTGDYRIRVGQFDVRSHGRYQLTIQIGTTHLFEYDTELTGTLRTRDSLHFRFHYTFEGPDRVDPVFLDAIINAFESAWQIEIDQLGWNPPPRDGLMGGNPLYDVYVTDLLSFRDALGVTRTDQWIGDNPYTRAFEINAATSHIYIENDFNGISFENDQSDATVMRATALHEFHHAIQMGYDALEPNSWLHEETSTWMETIAGGKDQDATGYVAAAFESPELCFGTGEKSGALLYGDWTFMQFLTDEFGANAVQTFWDLLVRYDGFDALRRLAKANDTTVERELARYRLKNLARDYELAPRFEATVWLQDTITGRGLWKPTDPGVQELGANYYDFDPPSGIYDVTLDSPDESLELWAVGLTDAGLEASMLGRGGGIDTSRYRRVYLMVFNPLFDENVDDCEYTDYELHVATGTESVNTVDSVWSSRYFKPLR